jgi:hypothetical protein
VLVGAAALPAAPVLLAGLCPTPPDGLAAVADAIDATLARFGLHDLVVLVGTGTPGVHDRAVADLRGLGRPDVVSEASVSPDLAEAVTARIGFGRVRGGVLPLDLAVLLLQVGTGRPVVPVAIPAAAGFAALEAVGIGIAEAVSGADLRVVLVVAADLSSGLTARSPLPCVPGAQSWDHQVCDVVDSGRLDGLRRLGPDEARRVGARGWPSLVVLHGAAARAKVGLVVRHYSAPRGVGYLVAHGA